MHLGLKDGDPQIQHIQEMKISLLFFGIWKKQVLISRSRFSQGGFIDGKKDAQLSPSILTLKMISFSTSSKKK